MFDICQYLLGRPKFLFRLYIPEQSTFDHLLKMLLTHKFYSSYLLLIAFTSSSTSLLLKEPYDAAKIGFTIEAHSTPPLLAAIFLCSR